MKIYLVTTWNDRCGIAEYASNLVRHCKAEFEILDPGLFMSNSFELVGGNILHINHEPGLFPYLTGAYIKARAGNMRTIITLHTSNEGFNRSSLTEGIDRIVVHEKTEDTKSRPEQWLYIPMGIPSAVQLANCVDDNLGTCGFPFPWKGWDEVARCAKELNMGMIAIIPESRHVDIRPVEKMICDIVGVRAYVIKEYMPESGVIHQLSRCLVNVFPYKGNNGGISGAVRMGLASRRPVVISQSRQFRDLFEYRDEVYISPAPTGKELLDCISQAVYEARKGTSRLPNKLLRDMSWEVVAKKYMDLYESLVD